MNGYHHIPLLVAAFRRRDAELDATALTALLLPPKRWSHLMYEDAATGFQQPLGHRPGDFNESKEEGMIKWPTLVALTAVAMFPIVIHAQCGNADFTCGGDGGHTVCGEIGVNLLENNHCISCLYCQAGWSQCHPECGSGGTTLDGNEGSYALILEAARTGDVSRILELAEVSRDHVTFNRDRWAIQVLDCDGVHVTANLPLPSVIPAPAWAFSDEAAANDRQRVVGVRWLVGVQ